MEYDDYVRCRVPKEMRDEIKKISDRTDLDESEVNRRLLRLGLEDIEQIGDAALMAATPVEDTAAD